MRGLKIWALAERALGDFWDARHQGGRGGIDKVRWIGSKLEEALVVDCFAKRIYTVRKDLGSVEYGGTSKTIHPQYASPPRKQRVRFRLTLLTG